MVPARQTPGDELPADYDPGALAVDYFLTEEDETRILLELGLEEQAADEKSGELALHSLLIQTEESLGKGAGK